MKTSMLVLCILLAVLASLAGCPPDPDATGRLVLVIPEAQVVARAVPASATEFTVRVSGSDMATVTATVTRSTGPTQIDLDVPAGSARTVSVDAYNAQGVRVASGKTTIDIPAGETTSATITLDATGGIVVVIS